MVYIKPEWLVISLVQQLGNLICRYSSEFAFDDLEAATGHHFSRIGLNVVQPIRVLVEWCRGCLQGEIEH